MRKVRWSWWKDWIFSCVTKSAYYPNALFIAIFAKKKKKRAISSILIFSCFNIMNLKKKNFNLKLIYNFLIKLLHFHILFKQRIAISYNKSKVKFVLHDFYFWFVIFILRGSRFFQFVQMEDNRPYLRWRICQYESDNNSKYSLPK